MAYQRLPITRANPACLLFLLDHSGSMGGAFGGEKDVVKKEGLARAVNRFLQSLVVRCTRDEGVYHYFDIGIFGYGTKRGNFANLLPSQLESKDWASITEISDNLLKMETVTVQRLNAENQIQSATEQVPVWIEPVSSGGTPMCAALSQLQPLVARWIDGHPDSFPPIVIHITDGDSTDGDPRAEAQKLRDLSTQDGNVLLFNCHLSSSKAVPILFPASDQGLPDDAARRLFEMSSVLPPPFADAGRGIFPGLSAESRGFAFNAGIIELIQFIDMGTRAANLR